MLKEGGMMMIAETNSGEYKDVTHVQCQYGAYIEFEIPKDIDMTKCTRMWVKYATLFIEITDHNGNHEVVTIHEVEYSNEFDIDYKWALHTTMLDKEGEVVMEG